MCEKAFYHHQNDWLSTCARVEVRARKQRALVILPSPHWFLSLRTHFWSKRPSTMISFNPSQMKPKYAIMVTTLSRLRRKQERAKGRTLNLVRWGDNGLRIPLSLTLSTGTDFLAYCTLTVSFTETSLNFFERDWNQGQAGLFNSLFPLNRRGLAKAPLLEL